MDFSPLSKPINRQQLKEFYASDSTHILTNFFWNIFTAFLSLIVFSWGIRVFRNIWLAIISSVAFFYIFKALIKEISLWSQRNNYRYRQFAETNNLIYHHKESKDILSQAMNSHATDIPISYNSLLNNVGSDRIRSHIFGTKGLSVLQYQYTTGSGKNRNTYLWRVGIKKLSRPLAHTVFDSKKNNSWLGSNLPVNFDDAQLISVDANLDERFKVFAPAGYDIDTLSYITPEVIEVLIGLPDKVDLEIVDDLLYLYFPGRINPKNLAEVFTNLDRVHHEIEDNIQSYRDDRTRGSEIDHKYAIAPEGRRLKSKFKWITLLPIIGYFIFQIPNIISEISDNGFATIFPIILILAIIGFFVAKNRT